MELKKVQKFSLYLFLKYKINSNLKIQKILFFLRVYEKMKDPNNSSSPIFDQENGNFQAWTYGPVCVDSYDFMCKFLDKKEEIKNNFLLDDNKQFDEYVNVINNLDDEEPYQLVDLSHQNLEYINVRKRNNIKDWQPCCSSLDETTNDFINFGDSNDKIKSLFSL